MIHTVFSRHIAASRDRQRKYIENRTRFFVLFAINSSKFFCRRQTLVAHTRKSHAPSPAKAFRKRPRAFDRITDPQPVRHGKLLFISSPAAFATSLYLCKAGNTGRSIGNYAAFEMSTASIVEIKLSRPNRNPSSRLPCSHGFRCVTLCPFGNAPVLAKSINHTPTLSSS